VSAMGLFRQIHIARCRCPLTSGCGPGLQGIPPRHATAKLGSIVVQQTKPFQPESHGTQTLVSKSGLASFARFRVIQQFLGGDPLSPSTPPPSRKSQMDRGSEPATGLPKISQRAERLIYIMRHVCRHCSSHPGFSPSRNRYDRTWFGLLAPAELT